MRTRLDARRLARSIPICLLSAPGWAQVPLFTLPGANPHENLGSAVSLAGDLNGDGRSEVLVGAKEAQTVNTNDGLIAIFDGATGAELYRTNDSDWFARFGASVVLLGDIDGGGLPEMLIGAPGDPNPAQSNLSTGRVGILRGEFVVFGGGQQWADYLPHPSDGVANGDEFGHAVCVLGDLTGDGLPEFAVSAPKADAPPKNDVGRVYVYSGAPGHALLWTYSKSAASQQSGDQLGFSLSSIDDLSGDGLPEVLVGIPYDDTNGGGATSDVGVVHVLSGATGLLVLIGNGIVTSSGNGSHFGWSVAGGGDITGDGVPDFAVGAPGANGTGTVKLISGQTLLPPIINGVAFPGFPGDQTGSNHGHAVHFGGDLNGDGYADIVASAPQYDFNGASRGRISLYSGKHRTRMGTLEGAVNWDAIGQALAIVEGIVPGSQHAELLVGAAYADVGSIDNGAVYVHAGTSWSTYTFCTGAPNSAGLGAQIGWSGSLSVAANNFTVTSSGCPASVTAMVIYSQNQKNQAVFNNGFLCLGSTVWRLQPAGQTSPTGDFARQIDFSNLSPGVRSSPACRSTSRCGTATPPLEVPDPMPPTP